MTIKKHPLSKIAFATLIVAVTVTSGCSTIKEAINKKEKVVATAEKGETGYYQEAQEALDKKHYRAAITALKNLRTFYPTGQYTRQALLDLIYAQYQAKDFEAVIASSEEFLTSYPTSTDADYVLYVRGVTNMGGAPKSSRLFPLKYSQRDVSYLRLAFSDFQSLLNYFPNSVYAADAAQRMTAIYNDFAEHELVAARWYIKRDAYVAAANRAKWAFQYFPQSEAVPEAIAILAYSNEQLGLTQTADQYKTLLQINYPEYLTNNGEVKINNQKARSLGKKALYSLTFGKFGRVKDAPQSLVSAYSGDTYTQTIKNASQLELPPPQEEQMPATSTPTRSTAPRHIGLGLPEDEAQAGHINTP